MRRSAQREERRRVSQEIQGNAYGSGATAPNRPLSRLGLRRTVMAEANSLEPRPMHARVGAQLVFLFMLFGPLTGPPCRPAMLGDVDGDGQVTVRDASRLLSAVLGRRRANGRERVLGDVYPEVMPSDAA